MKSPIKTKLVNVSDLTEKEKDAIRSGETAMVVPHRPVFSNRMFTISLALLVFALIAPIWLGINGLMYGGLGLAAIGWMLLYKLQCGVDASNKTQAAVAIATLKLVINQLLKALDSYKENEQSGEGESKGTSEE